METEVTTELLEATKHAVETEMQAFAKQEPDQGLRNRLMWGSGSHTYFNNLIGRLPGGFLREMMEVSGFMDDKGNPDKLRSDLRNGQTPRESFAAIDKAIEDEGLSLQQVEQLVKDVRNSPEAPIALTRYVFPAYIRLRAIGYNQHDLCV